MPSWFNRFIGPAIQVLHINKAGFSFNSRLQDNVQILTGRSKKIVYHKFTRTHANQTLDLEATKLRVKSQQSRRSNTNTPLLTPGSTTPNLGSPYLSSARSSVRNSPTTDRRPPDWNDLLNLQSGRRVQGKAASLTTERRFSLSDAAAVQHRDKATKAHRRWVKKNRIRDASCGDDDDSLGVDSSAANVVLYIGLGLVCVGMVISFVGLGEKGFKTAELRLIGPSLLAAGAFFCLLRVLFCTCPASCCCLCPEERRRRRRHKRRRRKQRGETVSSSDDEKPTVSTIITRKPPPFKVNGDNSKHVVIPINRLPPTPTPPGHQRGVQQQTTHLTVPSITTSAPLPNYISDSEPVVDPVPGPSGRPQGQELVLNASMLV